MQRMSRAQRLLLIYLIWELEKPRIIQQITKLYAGGGGPASIAELETKDHDLLDGLLDDDHSIYALLAGRSSGQTLIGGTGLGENLTFQSTSHASRGKIIVNDELSMTGAYAFVDLGGNPWKTTNLAFDEYASTELAVRNRAMNNWRDLRLRSIIAMTSVKTDLITEQSVGGGIEVDKPTTFSDIVTFHDTIHKGGAGAVNLGTDTVSDFFGTAYLSNPYVRYIDAWGGAGSDYIDFTSANIFGFYINDVEAARINASGILTDVIDELTADAGVTFAANLDMASKHILFTNFRFKEYSANTLGLYNRAGDAVRRLIVDRVTANRMNCAEFVTSADALIQWGSTEKLYMKRGSVTVIETTGNTLTVNGDIVMATDRMIQLSDETTGAAANAGNRGKLRMVQGGAGVADVLQQCMKSAADTYSWVTIATG